MSSWHRTATLYLAAHLTLLTDEDVNAPDGGSGEVESETSVGSKTVRYVTQAMREGEAFYTRTSYGRIFRTLERRTARRGIPLILA